MSRIVTHRKCDNCGYEYDGYWSYGHPAQDIHYDWECEKCGYVNHRIAKAWPMGDLGWIKLSELKTIEEIKLINNIIVQSVLHGADDGGSYSNNQNNLIQSIGEWLAFKHLDNKYAIINTEVRIHKGCAVMNCIQIVKKE